MAALSRERLICLLDQVHHCPNGGWFTPIIRLTSCAFTVQYQVWEAAIVQGPRFFKIADTEMQRKQSGKRYREFLRVSAMSAGVYVLPAGAVDPQSPHNEDEMYYIVRGRARMRAGSEDQEVGEGSIIFVAAGVEHGFCEIAEELMVLVFFAPAETE
jgi:quercetin dioxygenase-like cupin family protein